MLPGPSSVSLACARLGWSVEDIEVISLVGRPLELMHPYVQPGRRLLVLGSDDDTPSQVAGLLAARGYGQSLITVLGGLGGPDEEVRSGTAATWSQRATALSITAVECRADRGTMPLPTTPGLPDGAYESDGQLVHAEIRAICLARLAAVPGQRMWDIGAGSGSIGIEWMRAHKSCRAVAVEAVEERAERIARNATRLGVPYLRVVRGEAPDVLSRLAKPDAVFIGGGLTTPLLVEACWEALPLGGRLVAGGLPRGLRVGARAWHARVGGDLVRVAVEHLEKGSDGSGLDRCHGGDHLVGEPLVGPDLLRDRLVLFDLDGTLVDSSPGIWASVRAATAALALPEPTAEQLRAMVGPPLQDGFALVLGVPIGRRPSRRRRLPGALRGGRAARRHRARRRPRAAGPSCSAPARSSPSPRASRRSSPCGCSSTPGCCRRSPPSTAPRSTAPCGTRTRWSRRRWRRIPTVGVPCWSATVPTTCWALPRTACPASGPGWGPAPAGELDEAGAAVVVQHPADVLDAVARL